MDIDPSFGVISMDAIALLGFFCLVALVVGIIQIVARWKVAVKLGQPGWGVLIPFYGDWVIARPVADEKIAIAFVACQVASTVLPFIDSLAVLGACAAIASFVLSIVVFNRLSNHFGHGIGFTIGLVLVPVVFLSILGFGSDKPRLLATGEEDCGDDDSGHGEVA